MFIAFCLNITKSVAYHGFEKILIVNGHGSNTPLIDLIARKTVLGPSRSAAAVNYFVPRWKRSRRCGRVEGDRPRRRVRDLALSPPCAGDRVQMDQAVEDNDRMGKFVSSDSTGNYSVRFNDYWGRWTNPASTATPPRRQPRRAAHLRGGREWARRARRRIARLAHRGPCRQHAARPIRHPMVTTLTPAEAPTCVSAKSVPPVCAAPRPRAAGATNSGPKIASTRLIAVHTDEGLIGLGSVFTNDALVRAALAVLEPLYRGENALEPERVSEKLHQNTFWHGPRRLRSPTPSAASTSRCGICSARPPASPSGGCLAGATASACALRLAPHGRAGRTARSPARREGPGLPRLQDRLGAVRPASATRSTKRSSEPRAKPVGPESRLMVDAGGSDAYWPSGYKWALRTARDAGRLRRHPGSKKRSSPMRWTTSLSCASIPRCPSPEAKC